MSIGFNPFSGGLTLGGSSAPAEPPAPAATLSGAETLAVTQDGEARTLTVAELLSPDRVVTPSGEQELAHKTLSAPVIVGAVETRVTMTGNNIDLLAGNWFVKTITGNVSLSVSNAPVAGRVAAFVLDLTNGGSATISWWPGVKWSGGSAPTLTASGRDSLGFFSHDGGATWSGVVLGLDLK